MTNLSIGNNTLYKASTSPAPFSGSDRTSISGLQAHEARVLSFRPSPGLPSRKDTEGDQQREGEQPWRPVQGLLSRVIGICCSLTWLASGDKGWDREDLNG